MGDAPLFGLCMIAVAWLAWWISQKPPQPDKTAADRPRAVRRRIAQWSPFDMRAPPPPPPEAAVQAAAAKGLRRRTAGWARPRAAGRSSRAARV